MEPIHTTTYAPYIVTATSGVVYLSPRLSLFIDAAVLAEISHEALTPSRVGQFLAALEALLARMDAVVGRAPPVTHAHQGRACVEIAHLPNAAGLAHHGRAGFACGPAFLRQSLLSFDAPGTAPFLHHVFGYEAFRNYIFPTVFTPPFKCACLEGDEAWGWLNQGFVNVTGCLLLSDTPAGIGFDYFGHSPAAFRAGMEAHLLLAIAHLHGLQGSSAPAPAACLSYEDIFLHERLPWAPAQSLDNLYSGIISLLFRCHGGVRFLRGFFASLPHLASRLPVGVRDARTAAENFMLACSVGARVSLAPFFEGLAFPLSEDAKELVGALIAVCCE